MPLTLPADVPGLTVYHAGTAQQGEDFTTEAAPTLSFGPGETSKTIPVRIVGDGVEEDDETFIVRLGNPGASPTQVKSALQASGTTDWNDVDDPDPVKERLLDVTTY